MPVGRYRKKPVEVYAVQLLDSSDDDSYDQWCEVIEWCRGDAVGEGHEPNILAIHTLEGTMEAGPGDWIICGVKGEFYPCKPDIFAATYEYVGGE